MDVVFVHGALVRDGEWWWRPTAERLAEQDVLSHALLLPSCGETEVPAGDAGLTADADALRALLDGLDDVVLVGHSYGGTVIAELGAHPAVRHRVLISSYLPDAAQAQAAIMADEPDPVSVVPGEDGTVRVDGLDADSFCARFLADADVHADAEVQREAWDRVVPQGLAAFTTPTTREGWREGETTYVVCTEDRSTSLALQRTHAARATYSVEVPTGHHPFVTRPDLVVEVLLPLLAS